MRKIQDFVNRGRIGAAAGFLAAAACCVFFAFPAKGQGEDAPFPDQGPILLDAVYGYQNMAKSGRFLPVKVSLKNQEEEAFSGTLEVLTMESDYTLYSYEYPLELEPGQEQEKSLSISLGGQIDQMYLKVLDEEGREAASKRLKLEVEEDNPQLFIGVLSDSMDRLGYLNNVGISYSTLRTRTIELRPETIPTDGLGLDQLDVLLITDFDTSSLTAAQADAVWDWVGRGGVLLFGTGARAQEVMSRFGDELLSGPLPEAEERAVNMGVEFAEESPDSATISLVCTDIYLNGGKEVLSSDEIMVLSSAQVGQGLAAAAVYDFGDIEEFCREHISYVDQLFTSLLGEARIQSIVRLSDGTASEQFWTVQNLVNTGDINRLPNLGFYAVAAAAYVILAGPGLYFFLKQRGLRRYYKPGAAALALASTGLIFIMSSATRFNGPFFTYATVLNLDSENWSETTMLNLRSPSQRSYSVKLSPGYTVYPITRSAYYEQAKPQFTGEDEASVSLRFEEEATKVSIRDTGAFESRYFLAEQNGHGSQDQGFLADFRLFDGQAEGTVTSHYPEPLENAALVLYNQLIPIGSIEPGETVELSGCQVICGAANYGYVMAEQVTGASRYREGDMEDEGYVQALQRTNLLSYYLSDVFQNDRLGARLVGFVQETGQPGFLESGSYEAYGTTLITAPVEVELRQDNRIYYAVLPRDPEVISGEYVAATNTMYGTAPLILEYYLGNDTEVESLQFMAQSEQVLASLRYNYTVPFTGDVYFYNYNTGSYDRMDAAVGTYDRSQLDPYLSPGNTLTVRYVYDQTEDYMGNIILPVVTAIGRSE